MTMISSGERVKIFAQGHFVAYGALLHFRPWLMSLRDREELAKLSGQPVIGFFQLVGYRDLQGSFTVCSWIF